MWTEKKKIRKNKLSEFFPKKKGWTKFIIYNRLLFLKHMFGSKQVGKKLHVYYDNRF
jgi:hypothetical protein